MVIKLFNQNKPLGRTVNLNAARIEEAIKLQNEGMINEAKLILNSILDKDNKNFDALQLLGLIEAKLQNPEIGLTLIDKALAINSSIAFVHNNKGNILQSLGRLEMALSSYSYAIKLKRDYAEAYSNRANVLKELKKYDLAIANYEVALKLNPKFVAAHFNKGLLFSGIRKFTEALHCFDKVRELFPYFAECYRQAGIVLFQLNRLVEAIAFLETYIEITPNDVVGYKTLASFYTKSGEIEKEMDALLKALKISDDQDYLIGNYVNAKIKICDWFGINEINNLIEHGIITGKAPIDPFILMAINSNPFVQLRAAETKAKLYPLDNLLGTIERNKLNSKINIAYFSSDFNDHAVALLISELFELHDKSRFKIYAFHIGNRPKDKWTERIIKAVDEYIDCETKSDLEVATLARANGINIAVDLNGSTELSRTGIFALRVAPIQLTYLGYLGTMGANYYDYLIADKTIVPENYQKYYKEKIIYLPSYQVNDRKRTISSRIFTRSELGLPEIGFIFCCFNNNYKITPQTFDSWMRILRSVDNSVLFLYAANPLVVNNLKYEAEKRGISASRLVFSKRIERIDYLARYKIADLFLDTLPYNAGTTASDALWMGLPVLTLSGDSFASRYAASLLRAIEIPELITETKEQYESLAIELGLNPQKLKAIKDKLILNKNTTRLFDTPRFARNIEKAYCEIFERYQAGQAPEHIFIEG